MVVKLQGFVLIEPLPNLLSNVQCKHLCNHYVKGFHKGEKSLLQAEGESQLLAHQDISRSLQLAFPSYTEDEDNAC